MLAGKVTSSSWRREGNSARPETYQATHSATAAALFVVVLGDGVRGKETESVC